MPFPSRPLCRPLGLGVLIAVVVLSAARPASAGVVQATYLFNGNLNAEEAGAPALVNVNPLGLNGFQTATVFGQTRNVFAFNGNAVPLGQQAGLQLNTTGLVSSNSYSVELVFEFQQNADAYRRILDTLNRASDNGFYVSPQNVLNVYEDGQLASGPTIVPNNVFNYVVLTVEPGAGANSTVRAYLNGTLQLTATTSVLNNNSNLLSFFLDDSVVEGEYSDGRIALLRLSSGALTAAEIAALAPNPFPAGPSGPAVPEPSGLALLALGAAGLVGYRRHRPA